MEEFIDKAQDDRDLVAAILERGVDSIRDAHQSLWHRVWFSLCRVMSACFGFGLLRELRSENFMREIRMLRQMRHPNVVSREGA